MKQNYECKYCQDEVCVNADCPLVADFCPVVDTPNVCKFEERPLNNIQRLLTLIKKHPELPVVPMVDSDVVPEDCGRWMGSVGTSYVGEYALFNDRFYDDDRDGFMEDYYDRNAEDICEAFNYNPRWDLSEKPADITDKQFEQNKLASERVEEYLEDKADEYFKRAIIVNIDLPEE